MQKRLFLLALIMAAILPLCGCGNKAAVTSSGEGAENFTGTMVDLVKRGKPVHCTYNVKAEGVDQKGEVYIDGKKARTDLETSVSGMEGLKTHSISTGEEQYIWSENTNIGMKVAMTLEEQAKMAEDAKKYNQETAQANSGPDLNVKIDFKCNKWNAEDAIFKVPSDIKFNDYTDLLKSITGQGTDNNSPSQDVCSVCNNLPEGPSRSACLKGCSQQ